MGHWQAISTSQTMAPENHQYDRPMDLKPKAEILSEIHYPSTIPIFTHDQNQWLLPNANQTTGFQRRKATRVVRIACTKRTTTGNSTD